MRAVDTNVVVRLIIRDDQRQAAAADAFIAGGAWVSHVALAEVSWVLESVYGRRPQAAALSQFRQRPKLSFADCLMVEIARKAGHGPVGTFDRLLGAVDGARRL